MTQKEALEFFNAIKDKKIKRYYWGKGGYFIPKRMSNEYGEFVLIGITYTKNSKYEDQWFINRGFKDDYWQFYDKEIVSHMPSWF